MTKIILTNITDAMKKSYLDYAMSVIVARALPDVRDGLKPVQRRIIYDMHKLGLGSSSKYSKSAKVVGDVLGKYHPHGDAPVYEALVRMAQDFSLRYTLIKGQGNFGSVDGDPAAAMRYTEVKLNKITDELLQDLEKDTVVWRKNFDGSLDEPDYLPSKLPNLLLNGAEGIAVGMATKIPSQNISELIEALQFMLDTPTYDKKLTIEEAARLVSFQVTVDDLMKYVKGPDFPTGGIIYSHTDIKEAYTTGRNSIIMRGVAQIEDIGKGKQAIIITELPYQVNKATLVQRIAELVQDKKIIGISDLRDESDREGIRVVVELKREAAANKILNNLFQKTQLQTSFPVNMVTLVDGIPQTLSLKEILEYFLRHRADVVIKRTKFDLQVAKDRAHILDGLLIAIDNIDEIVEIIKKSKSEDDAREKLIKRFKFSLVQTKAILDMQLKRLTALERDKILDELKALKKEIARLEEILSSLKNVFSEMKKELAELLVAYGDKRKTKVVRSRPDEFSEEELIHNEETYILLTDSNYVKQLPKTAFKEQKRGGKGISAIKTHEGDVVKKVISCSTHDQLLFFTDTGRIFQIRAWEVPEASRQSKGKAMVNLISLQGEEKVSTFFSYDPKNMSDIQETYVFFSTKNGTVKKTKLEEYINIRSSGIRAIGLSDNDQLSSVQFVHKDDYLFLVSSAGKAITFPEKQLRELGRTAQGVRGIKLKTGEEVTTLGVIPKNKYKTSKLVIITKRGFGKMAAVSDFREQGRGGVGVKAANVSDKTGPVVFASLVPEEEATDLILTSALGQVVQIPISSLPTLSRNTKGVTLMRFSDPADYVATAAFV